MRRAPVTIGIVLGLVAAAAIASWMGERLYRPSPVAKAGPIISECDGALADVVIQYVSDAAPIVATAYRQFLPQLPADVAVHVLCPDQAAWDDLTRRVGPTSCRLTPTFTGHLMTSWSRDRWVLLQPAAPQDPAVIFSPRGEEGANVWAQRQGDQRVGTDLAAVLPWTRAVSSDLYFDGGDFATDSSAVFVNPAVLSRNVQHTADTPAKVLEILQQALKRRIIAFDQAPDHHVAMYMVPVGNQTVLVGDPAMAQRLMSADDVRKLLPGGADFTPETQALFDSVANRCQKEGYRVVRMPVLPGASPVETRRWITYVNVIMDPRPANASGGAGPIVYMPTYRGAEPLNAQAQRIWSSLGFTVRPIDCTETYVHFGCLHCLVNVLKRQ